MHICLSPNYIINIFYLILYNKIDKHVASRSDFFKIGTTVNALKKGYTEMTHKYYIVISIISLLPYVLLLFCLFNIFMTIVSKRERVPKHPSI